MSSASSTVSSLVPTKDTTITTTDIPQSQPNESQTGVTVFDVAHVVDTKISELLKTLEEGNIEINARLDLLSSRVVGLQKQPVEAESE